MYNKTRDYAKEYENYHSKSEQKKNRAQRNKANRIKKKEGLISKNDGNDVHHVDGNPFNNSKGNLRVISKHANRRKK